MYLLYGILVTALFMDFKSLRIPNWLIVIGWLMGFVYGLHQGEPWYLMVSNGILILILFYPLYVIGAFGGGDIKLFSVIGMFLGVDATVHILILSLMAGAVCSGIKIILMFFQKKKQSFQHLYIHFSLPIFLGTILVQSGGITWNIF